MHMDDRSPVTSDDAGLFEHDPSGSYLHLLREVLLTYRLLMRQASVEFGLSGAQLEVLRQLALAGGRSTTSALARELAVDPAAVTRLVAGLERLELVSREDDERDGRRRPVLLTPAGRTTVLDFHARVHARESVLAEEIDPASVDAAMRVLHAIRSAFDPGALPRPSRPTSGGSRE
jgi:DNA-binding MarR family transcriptional regulator